MHSGRFTPRQRGRLEGNQALGCALEARMPRRVAEVAVHQRLRQVGPQPDSQEPQREGIAPQHILSREP